MPLFLLGAFHWFRSTWIGRAIAIAFGVLLALFLVYQRGKSDQRRDQKIDDLEFGADIRRRDDAIKSEIEKERAGLTDDERRERAIAELRAKGRLRD